ncbi:hypothetical protein PSA7680_00028 [Pseudoruegeria aquimaris]|uniref:Uncharacterized protein n=1 Tax=Pseudoruegeria aquimaris TaxID=393663 RepID=A0A1Y5R6K4_9RHOB|nr:hypothetical protein [Pseudoruegeria aquimaris]SLN10376.1 hypothetical protein PSA7680_00028 [Pseudoruegeria aquimaris]
MHVNEQIADELALEALKLIEATGNDDIVNDIAKTIGASSTTLEESFLTAVRVRRAEARARALIEAAKARVAESDGAAQSPSS